MYYYCRRAEMSAVGGGPGLESGGCCCGGGGGGEYDGEGAREGGGKGGCCGRRLNGAVGEEEAEARDDVSLRRKAREDGVFSNGAVTAAGAVRADVTREEGEGARTKCCCCGVARAEIDQRNRNHEETVMRTTNTLFSGGQGLLAAADSRLEPGACKRRACAFKRSAKRVCCGGESGACSRQGGGPCVPSPPREAKVNGTGTARGRVRLCRVRSFLATSMGYQNGVSGGGGPELEIQTSNSVAPVANGSPQLNGEPPAERDGPTSAASQMQDAKSEAGRRQVELEERTDRLWRRLQSVQVMQVEKHVEQQLSGLHRRTSGCRSSLELSRLARSCGEFLRTAEEALDSDRTASSSAGGSDSEEEEEEEEEREGRRHALPAPVRSVRMSREWQWMRDRAWLGSRWVWLQAQVSELEYRIRALTELYTHLRQGKVRATHSIPETPLRAPRPPHASSECRLSTVGDPLRKMEDFTHSTQAPPSPPSSAARVRPLLRQRRHRLMRLEGCAALGSKPVTLPCCCEPPTVCVLCGVAPPHPPGKKEKCAWMHQPVLDPCVHSVLSMPSDFPLALRCEMPPLAGPQSHSAVQWAASSPWLSRRGQGPKRAGRARRRLVCPRPPNALPPLFNTGGSSCRIQRGLISPGFLPHRASDMSSLPATPPAIDTPTQPLRRRRGESSFDIDNLVMPLGLAGLGARVQKLQYKEIITPSWRELDSVCGASEAQVDAGDHFEKFSEVSHQSNGEGPEEKFEVEDLSDAVFLKRHAAWESRERSRWGSWAQRCRRGRSTSSYHGDGKSSRGFEHSPCSPDPKQGHFAEGDTSPYSPLYSGADDPFYQMEDEQQTVPPWERRSFPLQETELQWLQNEEEMDPEEDACTASGRSQSTDSGISVGSLELSPRTPQPHQQHLDMDPAGLQMLACKPAVPKTQDSLSFPPSLALSPSPSSQLPISLSPRAHIATSSHRVSRANASPY